MNKSYEVRFAPKALKQLGKVPRDIRDRIVNTLDALALDPRPGGCSKLRTGDDLYRVRVGDYRVVYEVEDTELRVLVVRVAHRREVY